jgi:hypothetical protein
MRNGSTGTPVDSSLAPPIGASPWERELFDHLTEHVIHERELLEEYMDAARDTDSQALAYLIRLLVEDERRHHSLFRQLAQALKSSAELSASSPGIPRMDFHKENRAEVLEVTTRLLEREESDLCDLRRLHGDLKDVKDTTLWDLIVELMQRDTEKHIAVLRFARRHAEQGVS